MTNSKFITLLKNPKLIKQTEKSLNYIFKNQSFLSLLTPSFNIPPVKCYRKISKKLKYCIHFLKLIIHFFIRRDPA